MVRRRPLPAADASLDGAAGRRRGGHHTLLEALAMHPHVVDDFRAHPRVVTGPAKKGKVA